MESDLVILKVDFKKQSKKSQNNRISKRITKINALLKNWCNSKHQASSSLKNLLLQLVFQVDALEKYFDCLKDFECHFHLFYKGNSGPCVCVVGWASKNDLKPPSSCYLFFLLEAKKIKIKFHAQQVFQELFGQIIIQGHML